MLSGCASTGAGPADAGLASAEPEVRKITFRGNDAFGSFTLRGEMETKQRSLITFWKPGSPYNVEILDQDMLRLRRYYFDRGFLDTQAVVDKVEESDDGSAVTLHIVVDEGPRTQVGSVEITGERPPEFPPDPELIEELPLRVGAPLIKEQFDLSVGTLRERLEDAGYGRADVVPDTQVDADTHLARVEFKLVAREKTTFGPITINGAAEVPEYVIRREISFAEGDIYNAKEVRDSQRRIFELDMFTAVTPKRLNPQAAREPLEIQFDIRERKPRTVKLGVGLSSVESMRYEAEWTHRNIFQEGESLNLLARVTGISQGFEAELVEPYFLNRDTSASYKLFLLNFKQIDTDPFGIVESVFNIEDPFPAYDFLTAGGEWQVQHDFTDKLEGVAGLELTSTDFYNVDFTVDEELLEGVEDNQLFVQFLELEWNNRDSELNPRRGVLLRGKLDHSNSHLLSDVSYGKLELEGRYYMPLFERTTLALRLKVGGIEPYGGTDVIPANERFYAGGPGSVRGYVINRLGPLDASDNPIGGNSLIEGSAELRFPVFGPIGGSTFVDFGNVFVPSWTYRLDELKYSLGVGVYYMTPIGPLRFELALAIDPENSDITTPWIFGIGHAF
jgi:outer membrane protein assembly complex protein YaeT